MIQEQKTKANQVRADRSGEGDERLLQKAVSSFADQGDVAGCFISYDAIYKHTRALLRGTQRAGVIVKDTNE